jgi:hypothetical protein
MRQRRPLSHLLGYTVYWKSYWPRARRANGLRYSDLVAYVGAAQHSPNFCYGYTEGYNNGFIQKPISIQKLKSVIEHYLLELDNKAIQPTYFEHDIRSKI